jgi:hypothetical protein
MQMIIKCVICFKKLIKEFSVLIWLYFRSMNTKIMAYHPRLINFFVQMELLNLSPYMAYNRDQN